MNIARFSVKNSVLVNLLMIGLFIFGLISLFKLPLELNPEVSFNWIFIRVDYPGAAPNETEAMIVDPIEAEIQDVENIDEIQSTAGEGFGFVMVKFKDMSDAEFRERYTDIKAEVDKVHFPDEAEDPFIETFDSGDFIPVITINMSFTIPENTVHEIADNLKDDLENLPGISKIQTSGLADREIWVQINPERMNSLGVTFDQIIFALKSRNLNIPGGTITFGREEFLIRSIGEYESIDDIRNTVLRSTPNGDVIKIKDVAVVVDRRAELDILSRLDGRQSITFSLSKTSDANSIDLIDRVKELINKYEQRIPGGVRFRMTNDTSIYILRVVKVLRNNAILGMILIILLLYLFLGFSNAALAALGIPISFLITFILMYLTGYTLNGNTLFALVMVLGIIVDDAIIVIENAHRYRLTGLNARESAIIGTNEVIRPIISSIGTNIAAFVPLILLPGIMGKFMRIVPIIFSLALIASLFEAMFLLPAHYSDWTAKATIYKKGERRFFKRLRRYYGHLLIQALRKRYLLLGTLILVLFASFGVIPLVGVELFGSEDFDQVKILIKMPEGSSLQESDRIIHKYEDKVAGLPSDLLQDYVANVGLLQGNEEWLTRRNVGQILLQLTPREQRDLGANDIIAMLREKTQYISGASSVEFELVSGGPPTGKPISVKVQGKYLDQLKQAALALEDSIRKIPGAYEVTDDFPPGKEEVRIKVNEEKAALFGFNAQYIAMNVRYAFDGAKATEFRDGDDEIDVIVKYDKQYRSSLDDILYLKLTNSAGQTVALREMVNFVITRGPNDIKRFDQKRTILVTGNINEEETKLDRVNRRLQQIFPKIEEKFSGVHFKLGGQFEEFTNVFADITYLFALGILLIFLILGVQFNSYSQPLIILTTVPFALIGAMLGLLISGNPFSIVSMFGFVALAGIVVNDAIVLIDFINNRRQKHLTTVMSYWRSIVNSGRLRLRPIILTSLTTISGLIPTAFSLGGASVMWAPLANVILFGLLISTLLTLFVIPSLVAILDDIKGSRKKARNLKDKGIVETDSGLALN